MNNFDEHSRLLRCSVVALQPPHPVTGKSKQSYHSLPSRIDPPGIWQEITTGEDLSCPHSLWIRYFFNQIRLIALLGAVVAND